MCFGSDDELDKEPKFYLLMCFLFSKYL
jgi:hypothetical protein